MIDKSTLFYKDKYQRIENSILSFLADQPDFLSPRTINSPRAVGDAVESLLLDNFEKILGDTVAEYSSSFARRSMADLAFKDTDGFYNIVDVKTHRLDTKFNMPNLTSVERLSRFYEDDLNYFVILKVDYEVSGKKAIFKEIRFVPIEFLAWNCLTIGALGWGQIQIANANVVNVIPKNSRKTWMLQLCDTLFEFYPREISKITNREEHFKKIRKFWEAKEE